ncbi:MAG: VOC family protein [Anaerolineales bacterium]|nr:VOC family protein [Anaerolineales bacterium]
MSGFTPMINAQTTIGTVTLNVANLKQMTAFYRKVIGLQVLATSTETVTLGTPTRPLIHLHHLSHGTSPQRGSGLYHLALRVPNRAALARWLRHYVEQEAPGWQGASDHGVSEALYLSDPEGNGLEIYCDRPPEAWQVNADGTIRMYSRLLDVQALLHSANGQHITSIDEATDMGHIHLRVSDISRAQRFYVDAFGFALKTMLPDSALFVAAGGYHHHIGLNNWHSRGGPDNSAKSYGLAQFELVFDSAQSRQETLEQLNANYHIITDQDGQPTVMDPFQNSIVLTHDRIVRR